MNKFRNVEHFKSRNLEMQKGKQISKLKSREEEKM